MSDDGGGGDTGGDYDTGGGDSNDYSSNNDHNNHTSDTHTGNDYSGIGSTFSALSSAIDFTSAVESTKSAIDNNHSSSARSDHDYSGIGTTFSAFKSATESHNNIESTRSAYDNDDYSSTRLQIDDVPSTGRYISSGGNYSNGTRYTKYTPSNSTWAGKTHSSAGSSGNCNDSTCCIKCMLAILASIFVVGILIAALLREPTKYKPIKLEPLPKAVYNSIHEKHEPI